ncbi:MAG: type II secretion system protein [Verrucomicrobia bacterium]|nr:type II secretion system protein [Verrucomicrobiota bacterium]
MRHSNRQNRRAFTLVELLMVIVIIGILASLLLPVIAKAPGRARQVKCVSNLRQDGIGFIMWAQDHDGKFPMRVPVAQGGSREFVATPQAYRHVLVLSNLLQTPKVLACPSDTRQPAETWPALRNRNLSYLIGLDARPDKPMSLLAADRNITKVRATGGVQIIINSQAAWTEEIHNRRGNVLLSDGSAQEFNDAQLRDALTGNLKVGN